MSLFVEGPFDYRRAWEGRVLKVDISTSASAAHVAAMAHNATTAGLYEDLAYCMPRVAVLTLLILVLRAAIMRWVLTPFGNAAVPAKVPPGARYTRADTLERFNNCGWELIFYTFSSLFGLYAYSLESWSVWPSTQIWEGYPLQSMGFWFETYYFLGFGFYTSALVGVVFLDKPRSDYYEYLLHHLVTLFLIATSWHFRCHRYGLIILLLHDTGDVLLNLAKLLGYFSPCGRTARALPYLCFSSLIFSSPGLFSCRLPSFLRDTGRVARSRTWSRRSRTTPCAACCACYSACTSSVQYYHEGYLCEARRRQDEGPT